jgi:hypothetical protein
VAGQRQDLELPGGTQAQRLTSAQDGVDRRVAAQLALEEGHVVRRRTEAVGLIPAVVLGQHGRVGLDPRAVGRAAQQAGVWRERAQGPVAAAVIDVGVGDQHVVDVGERPAQAGHVRSDDLLGHVAQPRVYQQRALLADEQVLAHVALAQIALDAVDARRDLHDGRMVRAHDGLQ